MSTTERAAVLRDQQSEEVARDERARSIDKRVIEQLQREALADALRLERAMNGPSQLEVAQQRILELEAQRDDTAREIVEWVQDLQAYFPGATTMHDIYLGIEAMEARIKELEAKS